MNNINFDQLGGFPMETETLLEMQKAYSIFNAYGELAGDKVIVKGCELVGNTVADGFIYVDGELLVFKGGQTQTAIIIKQIEVSVEFETKEMKPTYYERYATFGSGLESIPWAEFKRVYPLSSALFVGELRDYGGAIEDIPWGWHLANGENGTIDMTDVFPTQYIEGDAIFGEIGAEVGSNERKLEVGQMPEHKHTGYTNSAGSHTHDYDRVNIAEKGEAKSDSYYRVHSALTKDTTDSAGAHTHSITLNNSGGEELVDFRPKRKVVAKIQFTGQ